jgi:hypothetical protein
MTFSRTRLLAAALALAGCSSEEGISPAPATSAPAGPTSFAGALDVDIRWSAGVAVELSTALDPAATSSVAATATLDLSKAGAGALLDASQPIRAPGRAEPFPEARTVLYTGVVTLPPKPGGRCGAAPVTLALALRRRAGNDHVGGALTAYCGPSASGVPERVFRLAGDLAAR